MPDDAIERARNVAIAAQLSDAVIYNRDDAFRALAFKNRHLIVASLNAFASQQAQEGWRPIDTAWQAGSNPVIVTDGQSVHGGAWWHSREEAWLGCDGIVPTHWRPLPTPPAMLDAAPSVTLGEVG